MVMRIGQSIDIHQLVEGRKLILGGVEIPYEKGLKGHSDADVLLHAIIESIIGALGEGDIGKHFPDTDDRYKGISSMFPLYLYPEANTQQTIDQTTERTPNLNLEIINQIAEKLGLEFTNEKEAKENTFITVVKIPETT